MSLWFETIRIENGSPQNLEFHQARINRTLRDHFLQDEFSVSEFIHKHIRPTKGTHRLRIDYDGKPTDFRTEPYKPRPLASLKVLIDNSINYPYKNTDRTHLEHLRGQKGDCDDILIVKNNMVTDLSYANIVLVRDHIFHTPSTPLLHGTMIDKLIKNQIVVQANITLRSLSLYQGWIPVNALLGFDPLQIRPIETICR